MIYFKYRYHLKHLCKILTKVLYLVKYSAKINKRKNYNLIYCYWLPEISWFGLEQLSFLIKDELESTLTGYILNFSIILSSIKLLLQISLWRLSGFPIVLFFNVSTS
ncbi:unnamed protein product [Rhizophagus irregularis]|nr:unnamed protein product [Rhizophagus irregularis]